jgi:hypothetical protein
MGYSCVEFDMGHLFPFISNISYIISIIFQNFHDKIYNKTTDNSVNYEIMNIFRVFFDIDFPDRNKDPEDGRDFLH